jgi:TolB-like protein/Tfp pilus assembly protein PilF
LWQPWRQAPATDAVPMIAVLPFENLGAPEDEYFADGMTDELTSRLASISSLGVISRTSSMQYKNTTKSLRQIGKELGVGFVLEGTIRWDKSGDTNFVRILPQLIDVANDVHIWTDNYERPLTQIFDVQTDIANRIAQALDIALGGQEHRSLENRSIAKTEAYDYYLRGNEYYRRGTFHTGERDYYIAIDLYRQAIEIDPDFASAYAALALTHLSIYWSRLDRVEDRLMMAKEAVDRALDLDPELADAHLALAYYYYWGHRDYDRALSEAAIVLRNQPNNTEAYQITAFIKRRQGKWEEAIRNQERAIQLDPRDSNRFFANGFTHFLLRNYTQAEALYNTSLSLIPDAAHVYREKLFLYLAWKGDVKRARQVLEESTGKVNRARFALALARCDVLDRDYESALSRLSSPVIPPSEDSAKFYLAKADIYRLLNDSVASAACYDSVLVLSKANLANAVEAWPYLMTMAFAYAGLSDNEKAVRCAKTAVEQLPVTKDAIDGTGLLLKQANVYVMVGDYDQALDLIEYLLSHPSELSVPLLKIEPKWDPLRDHPRFQALIEKYEKEHAT